MADAVRRFVCVLGLVLGAVGCGPTGSENPSSGGCGDGVVQQQETCDDGEHVAGDGCNGACQVEQGWTCTGAPSRCTRPTGSCEPGYTSTGTTCTDIDECASNTDNCDANATCTNTAGSFTCACKLGYTGNGTTCTDINECAEPTACAAGEACTNTPGSFTCTPQSCDAPKQICGSACVDTASDAAHCGECGNDCGGGQSCVESVCVGSGKLQISATWNRPGDGDLLVTTPTGKLIWWSNYGPTANTDFGQMDRDATTGQGPENIFWALDTTPPSGTYHLCFVTSGFTPSPSPSTPVNYTLTVRRPGMAPQAFTGSYTSTVSTGKCNPSLANYVASITYP